MTPDDLRTTVLATLRRIAPEMDPAQIDPDVSLRDQLDLDSMDFLNFVIALDKQLQVAVPEADYRSFSTLNGCVNYLAARLATQRAT